MKSPHYTGVKRRQDVSSPTPPVKAQIHNWFHMCDTEYSTYTETDKFLHESVMSTEFLGLQSWSITCDALQPFVLDLVLDIWTQSFQYTFLTGVRNRHLFLWEMSAPIPMNKIFSLLLAAKVLFLNYWWTKYTLNYILKWPWLVRRQCYIYTVILGTSISQGSPQNWLLPSSLKTKTEFSNIEDRILGTTPLSIGPSCFLINNIANLCFIQVQHNVSLHPRE